MARPVVILHGAYLGPAHYAALAEELRQHTDVVLRPDVGQTPLAQATGTVQRLVDELPEPPVVLAHSFGGAVGGALRGVAQLVFLSAFVLAEQETATTLLALADDQGAAADFLAALRPSADGTTLRFDPAAARTVLFNGCAADTARDAAELLRPDLAANFTAAPVAARWRDTPSLYVRPREDRTWPAVLPPRLAARCGESVEIAGGHCPFLSRPAEIAELVRPYL
jgi:pimeloyl-ACP methyl ester carboxylesterase